MCVYNLFVPFLVGLRNTNFVLMPDVYWVTSWLHVHIERVIVLTVENVYLAEISTPFWGVYVIAPLVI